MNHSHYSPSGADWAILIFVTLGLQFTHPLRDALLSALWMLRSRPSISSHNDVPAGPRASHSAPGLDPVAEWDNVTPRHTKIGSTTDPLVPPPMLTFDTCLSNVVSSAGRVRHVTIDVAGVWSGPEGVWSGQDSRLAQCCRPIEILSYGHLSSRSRMVDKKCLKSRRRCANSLWTERRPHH